MEKRWDTCKEETIGGKQKRRKKDPALNGSDVKMQWI
jgi:hypothetical protein